jgi:hypothetical protein
VPVPQTGADREIFKHCLDLNLKLKILVKVHTKMYLRGIWVRVSDLYRYAFAFDWLTRRTVG